MLSDSVANVCVVALSSQVPLHEGHSHGQVERLLARQQRQVSSTAQETPRKNQPHLVSRRHCDNVRYVLDTEL